MWAPDPSNGGCLKTVAAILLLIVFGMLAFSVVQIILYELERAL
jgi:hypothetical protein